MAANLIQRLVLGGIECERDNQFIRIIDGEHPEEVMESTRVFGFLHFSVKHTQDE